MGSLILLLVVIARQARLQASERPQLARQELEAEIDEELEMARFHASQYDVSREATNADLEKTRLKLGQIEDHTGQLRRQIASLKTAWDQLDQLEANKESSQQAAQSELASLAIKIRQLERELELAKTAAAGRQAAYSIVPYEGPHGTKRRPIYIECRADGLVLQPEGVVFNAADFDGPLDAGNPLDVGLRAVREYLITQQSLLHTPSSEPYPLLLVRPSGINFFYAGRAAMKSWGTEYGYELIGDDWELDFPEPDPLLAATVRQAVEPARLRQRRIIAAAPSRYGAGGDRPVYTVKPYRGGITSRGGGTGSSEPSPFGLRSSESQGRLSSQYGQGSAGASEGGLGSRQKGGEGQSYFGRGSGQAESGSGTSTGNGSGQRGEGSGSPGEGSMHRTEGGTGQHGSGQAGSAGGGSGEACENSADQQSASSPGRSSEAPQSLAKTRGRNWGLPDAGRSSVPITRPIRVECHADRLVIVPERGLGSPNTISTAEGTSSSIDDFVSSVWEYMEHWGRAGRGMYWRPVLKVYSGPGSDSRTAELEALLQDSGLIVEQAGQLGTLQ